MTVDHASAMWGFSGGDPAGNGAIPGKQDALRSGRLFPVAPTTANAVKTIRPYIIPWPTAATVDQWGVAFPGGIVGKVISVRLPSVLTTINADYEAMWGDLSGAVFAPSIVALPAVLPGGYTPSLHVPWRTTAWNLARRPTAGGWIESTWLPSTAPWGDQIADGTLWDAATISAGNNAVLRSAHPGWRKLQIAVGGNNGSGPPSTVPTSGSAVFRISHNADGSTVPSVGDGDTIDATVTITAAQVGANYDISSGTFSSDPIDLGVISATLGVPSQFVYRCVSNNLTNGSGGDGPPNFTAAIGEAVFYESSRVDIPYPVSLAGQGDLIAPGGYV